MSINSILGTARLAMASQQTAMQTTSHNIANAQTVGYTRQQATLSANTPLNTPLGMIGTGVIVNDITRVRDQVLDNNYRRQSSQSEAYNTTNDALTNISSIYGEPSDQAFASTLDQFWSAWSDLSNNPDSAAAKSVVQQRGGAVASTLNRYASGLSGIASSTRADLDTAVESLNHYSKQVAILNNQIVAAEAGGHTAGDLRDSRDLLLDKMSAIAPMTVVEHTDGSDTVYLGSNTIVDGVAVRTLQTSDSNGVTSVGFVDGTPIKSPGGNLGAMLDIVNTTIPQQQAQLDAFAKQLVTTVNSLHRTGWTQAGDALGGANWNASAPPTGSNVDFFTSTGITAASITLSTNIKSDASYIAAGNVQNGTGNNAIANQMAALRDGSGSILKYGNTTQTTSFGEYYRDVVTRLGVATSDAGSSASVYSTLAQQADTQRQSANGVSTDDELIDLTKHQQAYVAAARIITTANDMAQTLLDMIR